MHKAPLPAHKVRKLKLQTITEMPDRKKGTMAEDIERVVDVYRCRGFEVVEFIADLEFECVKDKILPVKLTTVAQDEHMGDIERSIR